MTARKHISPAEFDAFMKERWLKKLQNMPEGEKGFVVGCYFDIYFSDNKLVECAHCGIPLYVRSWVYEVAQEKGFPILCQFCVPPKIFKGTLIQDLAAIVAAKGER